MQDLDNNMDSLFRKAADNYPLKTGESRWDKVASALHKGTAPVKTKPGQRKRYSVLILLLLIGLLLGGNLIRKNGKPTGGAENKKLTVLKNELIVPGKEPDVDKMHDPDTDTKQQSFKSNQKQREKVIVLKNIMAGNGVNKSASADNKINQRHMHSEPGNLNSDFATGRFRMEKVQSSHLLENLISATIGERNTQTSNTGNGIGDKQREIPVKRNRPSKTKGFYLGLAAGPAFSEVKGQGLKKAGYDAGLLAGYRLTDRLAIESGLLFSKKYYYSNGKYFNMKMPGMDVLSLEGNSNLLEIPLKLRYNIIASGKSQVSISSGLSSFILTKEKNDYLLLISGSEQTMTSIYKDSHSYFGGSVSLGAGYERRIGKNLFIRFEPYLKIPLKGIGVGTMQVMSTGLQVAVTRQSH